MPESARPFDTPERWMQAGFNALAAHIAVLDAQGIIVAVNAAWERFGLAHQAPSFESAEAQGILIGLQSVLEGRQASFAMEYPVWSKNSNVPFYQSLGSHHRLIIILHSIARWPILTTNEGQRLGVE
jgi:hypothetical protein